MLTASLQFNEEPSLYQSHLRLAEFCPILQVCSSPAQFAYNISDKLDVVGQFRNYLQKTSP